MIHKFLLQAAAAALATVRQSEADYARRLQRSARSTRAQRAYAALVLGAGEGDEGGGLGPGGGDGGELGAEDRAALNRWVRGGLGDNRKAAKGGWGRGKGYCCSGLFVAGSLVFSLKHRHHSLSERMMYMACLAYCLAVTTHGTWVTRVEGSSWSGRKLSVAWPCC